MRADEFFATARERHAVYLRRRAGRPWPWTDDEILRTFKFTNVFRELDRTTAWLREYVRDPRRDSPEVLPAVVLFRWFHLISTGQGLFCQTDVEAPSAFDLYLRRGRVRDLRRAVVAVNGERGPHSTGAYIVLGQRGYSKLDGILYSFDQFMKSMLPLPDGGRTTWRGLAEQMLEWRDERPYALRDLWRVLEDVPYLGPFMAYEMVTDLRWTALLDRAPDVDTWANVGPGARRGLARLRDRLDPTKWRLQSAAKVPPEQEQEEMRELLALSRDPAYWPQVDEEGDRSVQTGQYAFDQKWGADELAGPWPRWELRDVEQWLCEWDKYERVRTGQGRPRNLYRVPREARP